jgi:S-adenosylmethionine:tRNA ribosyltransferase-isomerase
MHPRQLAISDFIYHLPADRIAIHPLPERDAAQLLLYKQGAFSSHPFTQLPEHLPKNALLVFNNSKVIEARLLFEKETGGVIEVFLLEPDEACGQAAEALNQSDRVRFLCLVGGGSKWKPGMKLTKKWLVQGQPALLQAAVVEKRADSFLVEFDWQPAHLPFIQVLHQAGEMPIPPYLQRSADEGDKQRYQTIYASREGSVAAPTAGLHFTPRVFHHLKEAGISILDATLHVGAGTFKPVKSSTMDGHFMHAEFMELNRNMLKRLLENDCLIPVGTTSMRTLESIYWMGLKAELDPDIAATDLEVRQWDAYEEKFTGVKCSYPQAVQALDAWMNKRGLETMVLKTQLMIAPGYRFAACKGLVTNFHQPQSTLLLLVAALIGDNWKKVYAYALENGFRFLSYGDSSLLLP